MRFNGLSIVTLCIAVMLSSMACSPTQLDDELLSEILMAEDQRDASPLHALLEKTPKDLTLLKRLALSSGRISDFKLWQKIASIGKNNPIITDELALATLFPAHNFPKAELLHQLTRFPYTPMLCKALLQLDEPEALALVMKKGHYLPLVAEHIWRSKNSVRDEQLKELYQKHSHPSSYSLYRLRKKGIVKYSDIANASPFIRAYGAAICDQPDAFLEDTAWQVRVSALRAIDDPSILAKHLNDPVAMVRMTALSAYATHQGKIEMPLINRLSPMGILQILPHIKEINTLRTIYKKGGIFAEITAPYLPAEDQQEVLQSNLPLAVKLNHLNRQVGPESAVELALSSFKQEGDSFALTFLLMQKDHTAYQDIIEKAKGDPKYRSILIDAGVIKAERVQRPKSWYLSKLRKLATIDGFTIHTSKGDLQGVFCKDEAPLTSLNIIELSEKGYFNGIRFHRVIPAFVCQGGDPDGSGSGGPGYAIRCEYNGLGYEGAGWIGMALAGKDTGGSQFFITHQATPHLNHHYTIFAKLTKGYTILQQLEQYDGIEKIVLW